MKAFYSQPLTDEQVVIATQVRETFHHAAEAILNLLPEGRHKSLVLTNLEQASMWAIKAISHQEPKI